MSMPAIPHPLRAAAVLLAATAVYAAPAAITTTTAAPTVEGELKHSILAGGWIPFTVVVVLAFLFSFIYVRMYQHKREREFFSTSVAIVGLTVAMLTSALIPVDIYLVSTFKGSDGVFHSWASESVRHTVSETVRDGYYAMYALSCLFAFFILPLAYFYFEEKDDDKPVSVGKRLLQSLKFTSAFVLVFAILMCIGAFAMTSEGSNCTHTNATDVKDWTECRAEFAEHALAQNGGFNALFLAVGFLTIIGFLYLMFYTGYGLVAWPVDLIRARRQVNEEERELAEDELRINRQKEETIRSKYANKNKRMSTRDRDILRRHEERSRVINKAKSRLEEREDALCAKVATCCRPFSVLFGIFFILFAFFLVVTLLLTTADTLLQMRKNHASWTHGYTEFTPRVANPVDIVLTLCQKVYPIDYIFFSVIVLYFVICTMAGVRKLGVRVCHLKMYSIKLQRTVPQGLLFMVLILIFFMFSLNVLLLTLAPQYVTYGNQHFPYVPATVNNAKTYGVVPWPSSTTKLCTQTDAPQYLYKFKYEDKWYQTNNGSVFNTETGDCFHSIVTNVTTYPLDKITCEVVHGPCVQTRIAALLHTFFYNSKIFSMVFYWANWGFILVFFIGFVYLTCKKRKSLMQSLVNDVQNDFDDSDDDMVPFNPSWAR